MPANINHSLDTISDFLARRKGLLPILGIVLVVINAGLNILGASSWLAETDLLLHLGLVVAMIGYLLSLAL